MVEELWKSQTRHYAVEHTRIEAFDQQVESQGFLGHLIAREFSQDGVSR